MWLPGWLYELMPVIYALVALLALEITGLELLGVLGAGLLLLSAGWISVQRVRYRSTRLRR